ncbi:MAG: AEC family transporter, partial [Phycisphaeraceae bacterium]|nr:AEC family transporter [Phycisphaeraceae bacterium]
SLGGALVALTVGHRWGTSILAGLVKVAATPLIAWAAARALGMDPAMQQIAVIYAACPTAVASYVLVNQIGGDEELAAASVMVSTLMAAGSLGAVIYLTG